MTRYLARRLLLTIPVLVGVATLVFSLIHLVPGDPVAAMLGEGAAPADVARVRHQLGLDRPIPSQYAAYMLGLVRGDLGRSLRTGEPVAPLILSRVPATVELGVAALCFALVAAVPLGVVSAVRAGTWIDRAALGTALAGIAMPSFWLGPMLAIVFGIEVGWFPVAGRGGVDHLVLPAITLGAGIAAILTRLTRASVLEELREPFNLAARARGVSRARTIVRHTLRNSLIPIVSVVGLQLGSLLTGAVITETIFAWPGIGRLLIQAIGFRDYPLVQGCVLFIAATYVLMNVLTDLVYGWLDPRIRLQQS